MKKLLSSFILILIVLLILWAVSGWYFGGKAEKEFKVLLEESSQLVGKRFVRMELLDYKRTVSGAKASLGLSSDYPILDERMGDLELRVKLLNGPVFITRSGISVGSSRWVLTVVDAALKTMGGTEVEVELEKYKDLFPKGLPSAVVQIDFDEKAHYEAKIKANFADLFITGIFDLKTQNNRGAISVENFILGSQPNMISSENVQVSYQHQKALTTRYKPGTASLQTPSLKILHEKLSKPLVLSIKMNSDLSSDGSALKGYLKTNIRNVSSDTGEVGIPIDKAEISLQFSDFPADTLIALSEANDNLDNLYQQTEWVLEELGELPEGQDQIWQLYDKIEESINTSPKILSGKVGENSSIKLAITTLYKEESSSLDGELKLQSKFYKIGSWLSLLEGEAKVKLGDNFFKAIQKILPITKSKFKLLLRDNKILMAQ